VGVELDLATRLAEHLYRAGPSSIDLDAAKSARSLCAPEVDASLVIAAYMINQPCQRHVGLKKTDQVSRQSAIVVEHRGLTYHFCKD
jgi:hypothetical protein